MPPAGDLACDPPKRFLEKSHVEAMPHRYRIRMLGSCTGIYNTATDTYVGIKLQLEAWTYGACCGLLVVDNQ